MLVQVLSTVFLLFSVVDASGKIPGSDIQSPSGFSLKGTGPKGSKIYIVESANTTYSEYPPLLLDLRAPTAYDRGYDYGYLLGKESVENWNGLVLSLLGDEWWEPAVAELMNKFCDWQWNEYLSVQLPQEYKDEIKGITDGGFASGNTEDVGQVTGRGIFLSNLPGSLANFNIILEDEKEYPARSKEAEIASKLSVGVDAVKRLLDVLEQRFQRGMQCSMFGVWGSRTVDGKLFTGRNLDWETQTGVSKYKLITIHHPDPNSGRIAHATVGWAGVYGAITGISAKGITVHEANLESDTTTLRGFAWMLRLRAVMSEATNIEEALTIWNATNNTCGFNFGFGSASDGTAVVLETMRDYSAVFGANDPREEEYIVKGENVGMPRPEAVYRTNHGYDPYTIEHYAWNGTGALDYSITRYELFPTLFDGFEEDNHRITIEDAINITAIVGDKGKNDLFDCEGAVSDANNVLSVTFDPAELEAYVAWEGYGGAWTPAACNTYLKMSLKEWFKE